MHIADLTRYNFQSVLYNNMQVVIYNMEKEEFSLRLSQLRESHNVSARDMSLSLGQSPGYINNIENAKNFPSMTGFFYICEYLGITPGQFFDGDVKNPTRFDKIIEELKQLDEKNLELAASLIHALAKK